MGIHRPSKSEKVERDRKIVLKADIGVDYGDIGKMYGLERATVAEIVRRCREQGQGENRFRSSNDWGRACYGDGILG